MRIGVDATCWANGRGYGRFTRELLGSMVEEAGDEEFVFFLDARALETCDLRRPNVRHRRVELGESPTLAARADGNRSPLDMLRLTRAVWRERPDVFFSPSVYSYFPLPPRLPAVVTIHDAIAERFPEETLPTGKARLFWTLKVGLAVRQARLVLTVSEFSREDIRRHLGVPAERIRVSGEAPAPAYRPVESREDIAAAARRAGVPRDARWFTYVGGFNPHKRIDTLVRAHARVTRERPDAPPHLLLVGTLAGDVFHGDAGRIREIIEEEETEDLVRWTGFVPDEELRLLHAGAVALVLPSACEGFGLPAVEAAACGTPVVATRSSPLPELLAGGGRFIDPGDVDGLARAMTALLDDEGARRRMGKRALERARDLTWRAAARSALAAIREAAG